jgi:tetratricopeptide (TPR) repeat protein
MAENCYRKALDFGPDVSRPFCYTALAFVAYEQSNMEEARRWLRRGIAMNDGRHSQGWVALAQLEESLGHIAEARAIYQEATQKYEVKLIAKHLNRNKSTHAGQEEQQHERLLVSLPKIRSGDKWINVYKNWARMEEAHGHYEAINDVYKHAALVFPQNWSFLLGWAQQQVRFRRLDRARTLFEMACNESGNRYVFFSISHLFRIRFSNTHSQIIYSCIHLIMVVCIPFSFL